MKLTTTTQVSVDGVAQSNGGNEPGSGFERGGWAPDEHPDVALDLVSSRSFAEGITLQVYRPAGRPVYA